MLSELQNFSTYPENTICFDCKQKIDKGGQWISCNLGIFICIHCAGIHRSFGTHISIIQSLELDNWTTTASEEYISHILQVGNKKGETIYSVPEFNDENEIKKLAINNRDQFQSYLKSKYLAVPFDKDIRKQQKTPSSSKLSKNSKVKLKSNSLLAIFSAILKINLIKGINLAARDINGKSDPYVIFSSGNQSIKSKIIYTTLNPVWSETLMLNIEDIKNPLSILVMDYDTIGKDDKIGSSQFDLTSLKPDESSNQIFKLKDKHKDTGHIVCELELSLL